jgi:hypothetical protein
MEEENTNSLSGTYASSFINMTDEELEQEKEMRGKVPPFFHHTAVNVFHSQLTNQGALQPTGKLKLS